ncbi:helix-turn-helix domain-containing protein [Alkalicoccobacillus plakortidis]|uniref:helix-turn-helix domain-containing protein n=1 Tax=Alkalicoccobacillus plakortidis TaxID=444060 RepID=UPI0025581F72|nr:helix-turn-helix transcriptional regulator [Alkalicoccobacillus plakortidis]
MYGKRLTSLRKQKKLSQEGLTNKLGINRSTYARYEREQTQPDYDTLQKLADFFEVSTDYLLGRVDEPDSMISIAFEDGGEEPLSEDEKEHLEEMLKNFRETKKRWLKARGLPEED